VRVAGLVLCGGQSSRMGLPKAALPFGPEQMLQRVVRLLSPIVQPLVVVAAPRQELPPLPPDVLLARDRREGCGPLEGLAAGLTAIRGLADAAYATSCDVPLLVPDFVRYAISLLGDHQIVVPVEGEFHHPLAAVYRTTVLPTMESLLQAGRLRPVFLYDAVDTRRVPVAEFRAVDPELHTLANLNQPQDYFAALRAAGFEPPPDMVRMLQSQGEQIGNRKSEIRNKLELPKSE
jgi:molybdopterin-guanine dinucleotide biosynthesis protein A